MPGIDDENLVAVITGGSSGMGLECAFRLGRGHRLLIADINAARLDAAAAALRDAGCIVATAVADITSPPQVTELAATARSMGRLGVLVHAAGLSPSMADGKRILDVNLRGTALVERGFLPLARAGTAVVLIASTAGHNEPYASRNDAALKTPLAEDFFGLLAADLKTPEGAYSISKRGVILYCETVAREWGAAGARINTVSPGMVETPMGRQEFANQPLMKTMLDMTPLKRWGRAEDIAAAIEFLISEQASFITGTDLRIDGGITPLFKTMAA
jgi:NAD(P)-dependent dehydrogenase (short-subunit alcohol dehydrogenase family)